jgi:WD40 repeat protein
MFNNNPLSSRLNARPARVSILLFVTASLALIILTINANAQTGLKIGPVADAEWSPDGDRIAVAIGGATCADAASHAIKIIDAVSQEEIQSLEGHTCAVLSLAWKPDGTELASTGQDNTIRIWDIETGQTTQIMQDGVTVGRFSLDWSPDGSKLLSLFEGGLWIEIWDVSTGEILFTLEGHEFQLNMAKWSPDGNKIVSASSDETLRIWDALTGITDVPLIGHVGSVISVDWSPDGSKIVSGGVDNTVRIWDSTSGAILATFQDFTDAIFAVSWSADGNYIATGEIDLIGTVRVLQVDTGEIFDEIQTNLGPILDVEWSPDGSKLLFWGRDSGSPQQLVSIVEATIKEDRENAPIPQAQQMTPQQETVYEIVRSGNGQVLAVNYYYVAIVDFIDAATGDMIHKAELPQTPILMTLSPTGDRLLWIDSRSNIYLYDTVTAANTELLSQGEGEGRSIGPIE